MAGGVAAVSVCQLRHIPGLRKWPSLTLGCRSVHCAARSSSAARPHERQPICRWWSAHAVGALVPPAQQGVYMELSWSTNAYCSKLMAPTIMFADESIQCGAPTPPEAGVTWAPICVLLFGFWPASNGNVKTQVEERLRRSCRRFKAPSANLDFHRDWNVK